ncbi:hypothetical protein A8M60_07885 [Nocardia farcinica]|nr:hypothetical protein A8M60_07885 [Nocardia farcinica]
MLADHPVNPLPSSSFAVIRSASDLAPDDIASSIARARGEPRRAASASDRRPSGRPPGRHLA